MSCWLLHTRMMKQGDADGMGNLRKEELYLASAVLKILCQRVKVVDHPDLQDGFGKVWDGDILEGITEEEIHSNAIDLIITFDNYGVSGHCNHCDVHQGVRLAKNGEKVNISSYLNQIIASNFKIVSTNIFRKYSGPVDIWLSMFLAGRCVNGQMHCLLNESPYKSYVAMAQHRSQWIWFRKLFVSFYSYTYVNTLRRMKIWWCHAYEIRVCRHSCRVWVFTIFYHNAWQILLGKGRGSSNIDVP